MLLWHSKMRRKASPTFTKSVCTRGPYNSARFPLLPILNHAFTSWFVTGTSGGRTVGPSLNPLYIHLPYANHSRAIPKPYTLSGPNSYKTIRSPSLPKRTPASITSTVMRASAGRTCSSQRSSWRQPSPKSKSPRNHAPDQTSVPTKTTRGSNSTRPDHPHDIHIEYISDAYAPCIRPACRFPTKPPAPQSALPPRSLNRHAGLGRHYRRLPPSSIAFLNPHKPDHSAPQLQKKCR